MGVTTMNMIAALFDWLYSRNRRMDDDWRYVPEPPNWACHRGGLDYW